MISVGRKDDVLMLSTGRSSLSAVACLLAKTSMAGEKIVPLAQEGHIVSSPFVSGCVMFGREREQAGVLVEPSPEYSVDPKDDNAVAEFRNKIWYASPFAELLWLIKVCRSIVEKANAEVPSFAKVFKEMILVTDLHRPLPRSAKNTIIRKQAIALYAKEIDEL